MSASISTIGIIGSGAIGTYFGARLGRAGLRVRFLMRADLEAVRGRGSVVIRDGEQVSELRPVAAFGTPGEVGPVDLAIVSVKTTAGGDLAGLVAPVLGPGTRILTLQNGLGADERLAALFGEERILGGLVFMAATRTGPGEVTASSPPIVSLGEFGRPLGARTLEVAAVFEGAGVRVKVVENLLEARWRKLVWNIPFNGLSIAAGCVATDRLCSDPAFAGEVRALMREVQRAAAAFGFTISDEFLRSQFDATPPMGPYRPSSLVDFENGRAVEVEAIWGEPLRRARAIGVEMPCLASLYGKLCSACPPAGG